MKSKPENTQQDDFEQDDDDIEVDSGGPGIASGKKSKITIIALSSVFVTLVIYMFFFNGEDKKEEKLEAIEIPKPSLNIAPSEDGSSPFEIKEDKAEEEEEVEEVDLFDKPVAPEVPALPELSDEDLSDHDFLVPEKGFILEGDKLVKEEFEDLEQEQDQAEEKADNKQAPQNNNTNDGPSLEEREEKALGEIEKLIEESKKELNPRYSPIIVFSGGGNLPGRGVGYENNIIDLNEDPISELEVTKPGVTATYLDDRPHTIAQGKLLNAVLETAINTEVPGLVRAVVSRDVYAESGNKVLIPRGSRLFGSYTSEVQRGQGRVQIGWVRLIRPDGVDLAVSMNASDQFGRSGISGDVDNKYGSIIANSLLTSVLTVGGVAAVQSLIDDNANNANSTTTNATQGIVTTTGDATNQALADVSRTVTETVGQIVQNALDITPVIRVPQGSRITVIVNSDIVIPDLRENK